MYRIIIDLPDEVGRELACEAQSEGVGEVELARRLLLEGLARMERRAFCQAAAAAQTDEHVERTTRIARAMGGLDDGHSG